MFKPTVQKHCPHTQFPCPLHIVVLSLGSLKHDCKVLLGLIELCWLHWHLSPKKPSLHLQMAHSNVPFVPHWELFFWGALVHSHSHKYSISISTAPKPGILISALWQRKNNSVVSAMFLSSPQENYSKLTRDIDREKFV